MIKLDEYIKQNRVKDPVKPEFAFYGEQYRNVGALRYDVPTKTGNFKTFAFIAYPFTKRPKGGYPAVVLIHGGNGNAFYETARWWSDKGYIAIAPDFDGSYAKSINERQVRDEFCGPKGYGSINDMESENPWAYFSVLSAMRAIDFLLTDPNVNKDKICTAGLSWGGFLNLLLASVDKRIKCASIIYSSAFISNSIWGEKKLDKLSEDQIKTYDEYIDPNTYLKNIFCPVFFTAGTDDIAFEMENRRRTAEKIKSKTYFGLRYSFPHGNFYGFDQPECIEFSTQVLNGKTPYAPEISVANGTVKVKAKKGSKISLVYTTEDIDVVHRPTFKQRKLKDNKFVLDAKVTAYFVAETDKNGCQWSTNLIRTKQEGKI